MDSTQPSLAGHSEANRHEVRYQDTVLSGRKTKQCHVKTRKMQNNPNQTFF